jgi:hypothetical protein
MLKSLPHSFNMPRRRTVRFSKAEILLMLRAYVEHPAEWPDIIATVKANLNLLSVACRNFYHESNDIIIGNRLRNKFGKLLRENLPDIADIEIRYVLYYRDLQGHIIII